MKNETFEDYLLSVALRGTQSDRTPEPNQLCKTTNKYKPSIIPIIQDQSY